MFGPSPASAIPKPASWPIWLLLTVAAAVVGYWMHSQGLGYYLSMISRMMIYGLAACSLNLILGFGGMVALGLSQKYGLGAVSLYLLSGAVCTLLALRTNRLRQMREEG